MIIKFNYKICVWGGVWVGVCRCAYEHLGLGRVFSICHVYTLTHFVCFMINTVLEIQPFSKIVQKNSCLQQKAIINRSQVTVSYANHAVKSSVMLKYLQIIFFLQLLRIQMCVKCVRNLWTKLATLENRLLHELYLNPLCARNATSNSVITIILSYIASFIQEKDFMNVTCVTRNLLELVISKTT